MIVHLILMTFAKNNLTRGPFLFLKIGQQVNVKWIIFKSLVQETYLQFFLNILFYTLQATN